MTLAREINEKLDKMLVVQAQLKELKDIAPDAEFNNKETGEKVTKEIVLNKGREELTQIKEELNKITNNGKRSRDLFTNPYYVNDRLLDKTIADEIRLNKMEECLAKQKNPEVN
jgi:hypothetical protein